MIIQNIQVYNVAANTLRINMMISIYMDYNFWRHEKYYVVSSYSAAHNVTISSLLPVDTIFLPHFEKCIKYKVLFLFKAVLPKNN